jgi:hypothetical protein
MSWGIKEDLQACDGQLEAQVALGAPPLHLGRPAPPPPAPPLFAMTPTHLVHGILLHLSIKGVHQPPRHKLPQRLVRHEPLQPRHHGRQHRHLHHGPGHRQALIQRAQHAAHAGPRAIAAAAAVGHLHEARQHACGVGQRHTGRACQGAAVGGRHAAHTLLQQLLLCGVLPMSGGAAQVHAQACHQLAAPEGLGHHLSRGESSEDGGARQHWLGRPWCM